ncbi:poly(A)-specific ribonuclease [Serendipita sp. 400]|nr:poly(A)-specific ribonuclease [Serendipita sp. 400]
MTNIYSTSAPFTFQRDTYSCQISALSFDPVSDVLWAGNGVGQVAAFYRNRMRGVLFPVDKNAVSSLLVNDNHIYAMTLNGQGVGAWSKGGVNSWHYRTPATTNLSTFTQYGNMLVAMTNKAELLTINTTNGAITRTIPCYPQILRLHATHSVVLSGSSDGLLRKHDLRAATKRDFGSEASIRAHQGSIQAIEASGNWIYTIGWSSRNGRPIPDPLVKIFDSRNFKAMSSFTFSAGPSFLNVHPKKSTILVLTSNTGVVNIVDVLNPASGEFHQLDVPSYVTSSSVSPTADYIAFGDADGVIHLLSSVQDDGLPFNGFEGQPVEWADEPEPLPDIEWTDSTPLNLIGMPYYTDYLLSAYDKTFQTVPEHYPPPIKIPPQVLASLKQVDGVSFAQLPRELQGKRNVIPLAPTKRQGRFRSEKARRQADSPPPESPLDVTNSALVPRQYRRVEIEYSKFGVEDFDFGFYNRTAFSGLETHILNSYTNALIQSMHYVMPLRRIAKSHITMACSREYCLLCELGFVMRMLEDAKGINCQATNFCRAISNISTAATYGVVDYGQDHQETDYGAKIQMFNRFIIENIKSEGNMAPNNPSMTPFREFPAIGTIPLISQLLSVDSHSVTVCSNCKTSREKPDTSHIIDIIYPRKAPSNEAQPPSDFASILRNSLLRDYSLKAACPSCKQIAVQQTRRPLKLTELPPVLLLNASVHNADALKYWQDTRTSRFLKPFVGLDLSSEPNRPGGITSHEEEALSFPGQWKVPAVIYLERFGVQDGFDYSGLPTKIDASILCQDISLSIARDNSQKVHEILTPDELPRPGTEVAIDAEFVQMQLEETEIFADGTRHIVRPSRLGLARVSVLRGSGPKDGVPFIDDYIHTSEEIVNYLTEFSGIHFGDLTPQSSPHTLVPLKVAYKKLRLLIDLGCIFIGHGLSKDFRTINIFVPPEQVIDTVDLYFIPERQRRISLRFLTWFVLKQDIQLDTHDSIEDSRSALLLYKEFQRLEGEQTFDAKLEEIYRAGRENNWKPPSALKASPPPVHASPGVPFTTLFPRSLSPPFSVETLQNQFRAFGLDPTFQTPFLHMSPDLGLATAPYTPPRTPMHSSQISQNQHHHGNRKNYHQPWSPR